MRSHDQNLKKFQLFSTFFEALPRFEIAPKRMVKFAYFAPVLHFEILQFPPPLKIGVADKNSAFANQFFKITQDR